jgi:hypothetical protein
MPFEKVTMKDKEFECIQCGVVVDISFSQCPKCGLDFYPTDEHPGNETEPGEDEPDDDIHPSINHGSYAPWIEETETSLKLTLVVSRRIQGSGIIRDRFLEVAAALSMLLMFIAPRYAWTPSAAIWGLSTGIVVVLLVIYDLLYTVVGREII